MCLWIMHKFINLIVQKSVYMCRFRNTAFYLWNHKFLNVKTEVKCSNLDNLNSRWSVLFCFITCNIVINLRRNKYLLPVEFQKNIRHFIPICQKNNVHSQNAVLHFTAVKRSISLFLLCISSRNTQIKIKYFLL